MGSTTFDDGADISQAGEPMEVQTALSELASEAFHKGILYRLSKLNKVQSDAGPPDTGEHHLRG